MLEFAMNTSIGEADMMACSIEDDVVGIAIQREVDLNQQEAEGVLSND